MTFGDGMTVGAGAFSGRRLAARGKILVADSAPATRKLLVGLLQARGFEVDLVADGEAVLSHTARDCYSALILEVHLPECDAFGVLQALRRRPEGDRLPVLAICDRPLEVDEYRALRVLGASAFIEKRSLEDEVIERVELLASDNEVAVSLVG